MKNSAFGCALLAFVAATVIGVSGAAAQPAPQPLLNSLFQDHAVLQRDKPVRVWGSAAPGSRVTVALAGETATARTDSAGRWQAVLAPLKAGGPYDLTASAAGGATQTAHDLLIGDVWLCSGQSNMELQVRKTTNVDGEIANSANPRIRLFEVPHINSPKPQTTFQAPVRWDVAGPASVANFSAACFYFGRELQAATGAPIGLIDASWGGSIIQDWISLPNLRRLGDYDAGLRVLAERATDTQASDKDWQAVMAAWFDAHDPAAKAPVAWNSAALDDKAWPTMRPSGWWAGSGDPALANYLGMVWFRTHVTVTAQQAGQAASLAIGPVDDADTTWVNGVFVGGVEAWNTPRVYAIPAGVLRPGDNLITVRVLNTAGDGGLHGLPGDRMLRFADGTTAPIDGLWTYHISGPMPRNGHFPHTPWIGGSGLTTLYNGMIAPLGAFGIRGVAWYQGEANVEETNDYAKLLPGLIADWRGHFGADMPFLVVQLANFGPASAQPWDSHWAGLREVQRRTVEADPHAAMAVTIDIGDRFDIHPTNKQQVGHRLALAARKLTYGEAIAASGPTPVSAVRAGGWITVSFAHTEAGLVVYGSARPVGFELCDVAGRCRFVDAVAQKDQVLLDTSSVPEATKVRFCWADSPVCDLYNSADLPATPFEMAVK
jgi:sialate O-acetylesterase